MARCGFPSLLPLLLFGLYLCYLLLGAVIVSLIEQPLERRLRDEMRLLKSQLLNLSSCLAQSDLERFLEKVLAADRYGVSVLSNTSYKTNWDFASSFFFASTLITTVGYGHTTPVSDGGKAFAICFAVLGVPLTMLVLTVIAQRLMVLVTYRPIRYCQHRLGYTERQVIRVHFFILLLLVLVCFFLIPSAIFSTIERSWSFLDAFYFCFISLTTIGLGDYVPGEQDNQSQRPLYKLSVTFYLLCGITMMLLLIQAFHKAAGLHGMTQIFDLPMAEDEEDSEEMGLHPASPCPPLKSNGLKPDHQLQGLSETPAYESIAPSINR